MRSVVCSIIQSDIKNKKKILAEDIAQIYIKQVFVRYRVLIKIISDRDTRFIIVF